MAFPELTNFEKLAILRDEAEARRKELEEIARRIRKIEHAEACRAFLATVSPFYAKAPETEGLKILPTLETKGQELNAALQAVEKLLEDFENATGGKETGPQKPSAGRRKFDSFDDFLKDRGDA